jgi:transposase
MTRVEGHQRRIDIAKFVAAGNSVDDAAAKFKIHRGSIRRICREMGVAYPKNKLGRPPGSSAIRVLAGLQRRKNGESGVDVARRLGVTRQYVALVKAQAEEEGLKTGPGGAA